MQLDHIISGGAAIAVSADRLPPLPGLQNDCRLVARSRAFIWFLNATIVAVGVAEAAEVQGYGDHEMLMWLHHAFLAIFTIEIIVKVGTEGETPMRYFERHGGWNTFDFTVGVLSYIGIFAIQDHSDGKVLRLLRLLRVVRLLNEIPSLHSVTAALFISLRNVVNVVAMLGIFNFVCAVLAKASFGENDPDHFAHVSRALVTIWQVETLDDWGDILYTNMLGCFEFGYSDLRGYTTTAISCHEDLSHARGYIAFFFFFVVVLIGGLVLPTVLIGVIAIAFDESTRQFQGAKRERVVERKVVAIARGWPGVAPRARPTCDAASNAAADAAADATASDKFITAPRPDEQVKEEKKDEDRSSPQVDGLDGEHGRAPPNPLDPAAPTAPAPEFFEVSSHTLSTLHEVFDLINFDKVRSRNDLAPTDCAS